LLRQREQECRILAGLTDDQGERLLERISIRIVDGKIRPEDALRWSLAEVLAARGAGSFPLP
jgi:hypothetical protein